MTKQKTIKNTVTIEGVGLQTGAKATLRLKSSPANSGINFIRTDLPNKPLLNLQSLDLTKAIGSPERPFGRAGKTQNPKQIPNPKFKIYLLVGKGS